MDEHCFNALKVHGLEIGPDTWAVIRLVVGESPWPERDLLADDTV